MVSYGFVNVERIHFTSNTQEWSTIGTITRTTRNGMQPARLSLVLSFLGPTCFRVRFGPIPERGPHHGDVVRRCGP